MIHACIHDGYLMCYEIHSSTDIDAFNYAYGDGWTTAEAIFIIIPFDFIFIKETFKNNNNNNSRLLRVKRACVRDEPVQSPSPTPSRPHPPKLQ